MAHLCIQFQAIFLAKILSAILAFFSRQTSIQLERQSAYIPRMDRVI